MIAKTKLNLTWLAVFFLTCALALGVGLADRNIWNSAETTSMAGK